MILIFLPTFCLNLLGLRFSCLQSLKLVSQRNNLVTFDILLFDSSLGS